MPAPLIEFAQFAHPQRWWLRRGEPPWLDDDRWWVRGFRITLVLGVMGIAGGWVAAGFAELQRRVESFTGSADYSESLLLLSSGVWFGVLVLVPMSRWLGRGWILSLWAIPFSMLANFAGIFVFLTVSPILESPPKWIPGGESLAGFYAGFIGAVLVSGWMGHPMKKTAWISGTTASLLAGIGCNLHLLMSASLNWSLVPDKLAGPFSQGLLYVTFQSLTAMGLGIRLWRAEKRFEHENDEAGKK